MILAELAPPARDFTSDTAAAAHPAVVASIVAANGRHVPSYGTDPLTGAVATALADLCATSGPVRFAFTGTGANIALARALLGAAGGLLVTTEHSHMACDEADGPAVLAAAELVTVPAPDGKLTIAALEPVLRLHADEIAAGRPALIAFANATEMGTVMSETECIDVVACAQRYGARVMLDGARLAHARAATSATFADYVGGTGVDAAVLGGTKLGLFGAEAVVFAQPVSDLDRIWKQQGQVASKSRFLAAQFQAWCADGLAVSLAGHANAMAARLAAGLHGVGYDPVLPVEANMVFVRFDAAKYAALSAWTPCEPWDDAGLVRFCCSWDTTADDVAALVSGVSILGRG